MKKWIAYLLLPILCLSLVIPASAAEEEPLVYDEAGLLTYQYERLLEEKLQTLSEKHNVQFVVITLPNLEGYSADWYVEALYDGMDLGYGDSRDGVLLMVSMNPREFRILSNGMPGRAIDTNAIGEITESITPELSAGNYYGAFASFAELCDGFIDSYVNFDLTGNLVVALGIGLVVGFIVVLTLKGQLKTVRMQRRAHNYVKPGSMNLTISRDLFLYRTVNRVRRQTNSGSGGGRSGGSGSRSVGGGRF